MNEFAIIAHYFKPDASTDSSVHLGSGDDAAAICPTPGKLLLVSTDTMLEGRHFLKDFPVSAIITRALQANISDICAMGGKARWLVVALTIPDVDEPWLKKASDTLKKACLDYGISLVGGDLSKGPLSITMTIFGEGDKSQLLTRKGANANDKIYVTNHLGEVAHGLNQLGKTPCDENARCYQKLFYPKAQVDLAPIIAKYASSALDISDGLLQDLNHLTKGAILYFNAIPVSDYLSQSLGEKNAKSLALSSGEEFELLFTVSKDKEPALLDAISQVNGVIHCIGEINQQQEIIVLDGQQQPLSFDYKGYQHF